MPFTPSAFPLGDLEPEVVAKHVKVRESVSSMSSLDMVREFLAEVAPIMLDALEKIYGIGAVVDLALLLVYRSIPYTKIIVVEEQGRRKKRFSLLGSKSREQPADSFDDVAYSFMSRFGDCDELFREIASVYGRGKIEEDVYVVSVEELPRLLSSVGVAGGRGLAST